MRPAIILAALALLGCTRPQPTPAAPAQPVQPEEPVQPRGADCILSSDCGDDERCDAGACRRCKPGECPPCQGCFTDDNCPPDHVCMPDYTHPRYCMTCFHEPPRLPPDPKRDLLAMQDGYLDVRDYTALVVRREHIDGKLQDREFIQLKFREPDSIYLKWVGGEHQGRETVYAPKLNAGKVRTHSGKPPDRTIELDPADPAAKLGSRHPISEFSHGFLVRRLHDDLERAERRPQDGVKIIDRGESKQHDRAVHCYEVRHAAADGYYAPHLGICKFSDTGLLSRIQVRDAGGTLVSDYEFRDLKTRVGLGDADFAATNPAYNFPR